MNQALSGMNESLASAKPLLVRKVWASNPSARPSVGGSAGGLILWATRFPPAGWRSPRRRWNVAWDVCPGLMSEVWT